MTRVFFEKTHHWFPVTKNTNKCKKSLTAYYYF